MEKSATDQKYDSVDEGVLDDPIREYIEESGAKERTGVFNAKFEEAIQQRLRGDEDETEPETANGG